MPRRLMTRALTLAAGLALALAGPARAQSLPDLVTTDALRVCADPGNMPFSERQGDGFENRIAAILADELKVKLRYYWLTQGRASSATPWAPGSATSSSARPSAPNSSRAPIPITARPTCWSPAPAPFRA